MIKDSGERRQFSAGAVRDIQKGKGRCDLMPLDVISVWLDSEILHNIYRFQDTANIAYLYEAINNYKNQLKPNESKEQLILELSRHFEEGAEKYGEHNWEKGIPAHCYIDSAIRHYLKYLKGDNDEPHDRAFLWNIMCCMWTCVHLPEFNDYLQEDEDDERECDY